MSEDSYRVHVVVDLEYGERLRDLPASEPAWVVDSKDNHPVIEALWREPKATDESGGITSFKYNADDKPEDWLIAVLSAVDLHHGEYSHDPPYSVLNVIGVEWSSRIQDELERFGFGRHETTVEGFVVVRLRGDDGVAE
jgi:hypothetical protein